jgi:hypothetical protein
MMDDSVVSGDMRYKEISSNFEQRLPLAFVLVVLIVLIVLVVLFVLCDDV